MKTALVAVQMATVDLTVKVSIVWKFTPVNNLVKYRYVVVIVLSGVRIAEVISCRAQNTRGRRQ